MSLSSGRQVCFRGRVERQQDRDSRRRNKIFSVDVVKVNTLRVKGKKSQLSGYGHRIPEGKSPQWKKGLRDP